MQVEFNQKLGRLSFSHPDLPEAVIRGASAWVSYWQTEGGALQKSALVGQGCATHDESIADVHGPGRQMVIQCPTDPGDIELIYRIRTYLTHSYLLLQLTVHNAANHPIYLHECCLLHAEPRVGGGVQLSKPIGGLRFFKVGWHGWDYTGLRLPKDRNKPGSLDFLTRLSYSNPTVPIPVSRGEFLSEGWGILADAWVACVAGFVSTAHQFGQVYTCLRPGEEAISISLQMDKIRLDPGESRDTEWAYLQFFPLPNAEPAADFIDAVARQMEARVPGTPPPAMWTHWYRYYHHINEQLILDNLEALAHVQADAPLRVVELDDGYQSAWGDWTITNDRFPHGLKWLAGEISAKGFIPGLWLAPFAVHGKSSLARHNPDWLVKDRHGKASNAGFLYNMSIHALDLTHPAVLEHLVNLTHKLTHEWGFRMLKIDFLNAGALPGLRHDPKQTRAEALRSGLEAIRKGVGEETFLLGCGCPFGAAIGVVDAMRIGPDTAPSWEPYLHWLPYARPLIKSDPSMPSLRNALRHAINLSCLHQGFWWNDPDCLLVRDVESHLTRAEIQSAVTLVGMSGGMLVSSDDLRSLNPSRLRWVSLLLPNLGLKGYPLDWLEHEMPQMYILKHDPDGAPGKAWRSVALFNWSDQPADCCLWFDKLGYASGTELQIYDFWSGHFQRTSEPSLVYRNVAPHGCKLLRVCEVSNTPQLVADTLHISQGAEIESMRIVDDHMILDTVDMGRRVEGEVWLSLDHAPIIAQCNGEAMEVEDKGEGVYAVRVKFFGKGKVEVGL